MYRKEYHIVIESIKSIIIEMGVDALFGKVSNFKNKIDMKSALNLFIESQQQNVFEFTNLDNEIDYNALTDYIKKEAFNEIIAYIICINTKEIELKLQSILNKAKYYAKANNADKENLVEKFVKDVIYIIRRFYIENEMTVSDKLSTQTIIHEIQKINTSIQTSAYQNKTIQLLTKQNVQLIDENTQLIDENTQLFDENARLINEKFNKIVQSDINYGSDAAWEKLKPYVENIENATNENYTNYFYWAAQYCLFTNIELSEKYFNIAKSLSPTLDTRVYESSKLIIQGNFNNAVELLSNIDSIAILNQLLNIAFISEDNLNINELIQNAEIETNEYTEYLIGLNYFKLSDFDNAAIHVNIALDKFPQSARVYFSLGCVYYWKALENLIYSKPIHGLTIFFHNKPKITFEQEKILQKAFDYFKKSYDYNNGQANELTKIALCGCMYSSWIIGNTDYFLYHSKLLEIEPLNPAGIAFNWACNVLLDENIINEVEQNVISQPSDEILLTVLIWQFISDKRFERATICLNMVSYKDNVSKNLISHLKIDIALANDDNEEALKVLTTCDISDEERKRIELQLLMSDKNSSKNSKINLAKELKTKYKTSIDYRNFCKVLMMYKKYKSVSKISSEWYNVTKNISALFYNIFALYNLQEYEKCLELISELEKIANIDEQTQKIKSYCYINTSKLDEAIAIIGDNGVPDDEDAAIQLARLYKSKGDLQRGISILTEFINNNNIPKNAAIELCEYLKSQDNNERFKYLDLLVSIYPNDHRIKYEWFLCGMMTGHEQEVASYMQEMQTHKNTKYKKNKLVPYTKILKGKEIIDFFKKQVEWQKKHIDDFYNCSITVHAVINGSNTLVQQYYNWYSGLFYGLPIHYGGRRIKLPDNFLYKKIVIDYTALLTMYSLELFMLLENHFSEIFISPNIFHIIDNEISILNNNQKFCYDAEKKLLDYINRNPSQITQVTSIKDVEEIDGVWEVDTYNYKCAKSVNALIVDSNSGTEIFYKNKLPKEYEESRISEYDIISFLQEKGLNINLPQKPKNMKVNLHKINLKDNLLVDENFLTELQKQIDLSDITCLFNIFITERTYHSIKGGVDGVDNKKSCAEWLANLKEMTQNLINKGVMKFLPVYPESEKVYKIKYPLFGLFEESFRFAYKENIGFWCDDRTFMSYGGINTPVILNALMKNELITVKQYYNVISKMLARGIYYFLPDVDYILNCLKTAPLENEELIETTRMKNIRKAVAYALHESTFLSKNISKSSQFPESNEYMLNLHNIYDNAMTSIWNDKNKSIQWKFSSANWCLMYLSDFIWDVSFIEKNNLINGNVYIQFELLSLCLKFNSIEIQQQYCNWLFYWLRIRWQYNIKEPFELINKFASFLIDVTVEDIGYSIDDYQKIILLLLSRCFPDDFMYHLLHSPIFGGKWENLIPFKIEEVKQSVINKENLFEQIDCDDLIEYYYINPEKWYDILFTATSKKDNPAMEIVAFMKRYIQTKGTEKITKECIEYIKLLTWVSPSNEKLAFQELKRMLL